jgi:hypothetical protein
MFQANRLPFDSPLMTIELLSLQCLYQNRPGKPWNPRFLAEDPRVRLWFGTQRSYEGFNDKRVDRGVSRSSTRMPPRFRRITVLKHAPHNHLVPYESTLDAFSWVPGSSNLPMDFIFAERRTSTAQILPESEATKPACEQN